MAVKKTKATRKAKKAKASPAKAKGEQTISLPSYNEVSFVMMFNGINEENRELLKEDPAEFMFSVYNVEIPVEYNVVENDAKTIHLALPFYRPRLTDK